MSAGSKRSEPDLETTMALDPGDLEELEGFEKARRLGRYELVAELGRGGMANVYLARVSGPAGFRKWFAIKCIHPHLARDRRFVNMFLDEARISASLSHPNVGPVFDLGEDNGTFFFVMEYLHGEHLGKVASEAARRAGRIAPGLGAYIIAQAADGLHHAHETKDETGTPLGIVHRDVSPHNIFVRYDGTVLVTDFGIAKAANRITQTETGGTKGKLAYMSPEQVRGQPIDRRSDVFALGTVLWELTTGRRLFKAQNDGATVLRITSGNIPRPSEIDLDYPPTLEQIVMRALSNDPEGRFPTAAAMARALDRFVASLDGPVGPAALAGRMSELFAPRKAAKDALLRGSSTIPVTDAFPVATEGSSSAQLPLEPSHVSRVKGRPSGASPSRRWFIAAFVLFGIAAGVAAGLLMKGDDVDPEPAASPTAEPAPTPSEAASAVASTPPEEEVATGENAGNPEEPAAGERASGRDAPPRDAPPPDAPTETPPSAEEPAPGEAEASARMQRRGGPARAAPGRLTLITVPWAEVSIDGRRLGRTPLVNVEVPSGLRRLVLRPEGGRRTERVRLRVPAGGQVSRRIVLDSE